MISQKGQSGEIAVLLTLLTVLIMLSGIIAGSRFAKRSTEIRSFAVGEINDGQGGYCRPNWGGADNLGCGGLQGCREWEYCDLFISSCIDTTCGVAGAQGLPIKCSGTSRNQPKPTDYHVVCPPSPTPDNTTPTDRPVDFSNITASNSEIMDMIERFIRGGITPEEMSLYITKLTRWPGLQMKVCEPAIDCTYDPSD